MASHSECKKIQTNPENMPKHITRKLRSCPNKIYNIALNFKTKLTGFLLFQLKNECKTMALKTIHAI
jgi:hypothetical protein